MSSERSIESSAENVEDAIAKGLAELGVSPGDVIIEVLEEPSRGVFGIGARPARVRLTLLRAPLPPQAPPALKTTPPPAASSNSATKKSDIDAGNNEEEDAVSFMYDAEEIPEGHESLDEDVRVSKVVLEELLAKMDILRPKVVIRRPAAGKDDENTPWLLDISGPDLSTLVSRRGETLAALQYITRLIASRELQHRANIVVDAAGYKSRRSRMLRDLAIRMADQAAQSNRVVTLEPMPSYERRIIHLTLRDRQDVQTKSVGEGNARKVTIVPK